MPKRLLPDNWPYPRFIAVSLVSTLYILLGISWAYIAPVAEMIPELARIRPWLWIAVGIAGLWVSNNDRYSVYVVGLMGGLAVERIVVLSWAYVRGYDALGWYTILWYLALWFASCFANYLPEQSRLKARD